MEDEEKAAVAARITMLKAQGPSLGPPIVKPINQSRHGNMRELRVSLHSHQCRILFAFDNERTAVMLYAGDKTGDWNRWYDEFVPVADGLFDDHLASLVARHA